MGSDVCYSRVWTTLRTHKHTHTLAQLRKMRMEEGGREQKLELPAGATRTQRLTETDADWRTDALALVSNDSDARVYLQTNTHTTQTSTHAHMLIWTRNNQPGTYIVIYIYIKHLSTLARMKTMDCVSVFCITLCGYGVRLQYVYDAAKWRVVVPVK